MKTDISCYFDYLKPEVESEKSRQDNPQKNKL